MRMVNPTCRACPAKFEIPFEDRVRVFYCPRHDRSGYWDLAAKVIAQAKVASDIPANAMRPDSVKTLFQKDNQVVCRVKVDGRILRVYQVTITGRTMKVGAERQIVKFSDVEDYYLS